MLKLRKVILRSRARAGEADSQGTLVPDQAMQRNQQQRVECVDGTGWRGVPAPHGRMGVRLAEVLEARALERRQRAEA